MDLSSKIVAELTPKERQYEIYDSSFLGLGSFGVRVSPKGRKTFFYIYSFNGKRSRVSLGKYSVISCEIARKKALDLTSEIQRGTDPRFVINRLAASPTFRDISQMFIEESNLKLTTLSEYKRVLNKDFISELGSIKITEINQDRLLSLLQKIANQRGSHTMANRARSVLNSLFEFAYLKGFIDSKIIIPHVRRLPQRSKTIGRLTRVLSESELKSIFNALKNESSVIFGIFSVILLTAQKPGIVSQMSWSDIRLNYWYPTAEKWHKIYLTPYTSKLLHNAQDGKTYSDQPFVFLSTNFQKVAHLRKKSKQISEQLSSLPWSPADLQRTAEDGLRKIGLDELSISKVTNKKSIISAFQKRLGGLQDEGGFQKKSEVLIQESLIRWSDYVQTILKADDQIVKGQTIRDLKAKSDNQEKESVKREIESDSNIINIFNYLQPRD